MVNFVIDSNTKLKAKLEMIESLSEIEIATKIIEECKGNKDEEDVLKSHYKKLNCDINPIERNVKLLKNYF